MPDPTTGPPARLEGVRTVPSPSLVGSRCPVCREQVLQGRQTVCSGGRCRAKRWRDSRVTRDPENPGRSRGESPSSCRSRSDG
jgi:hypothetical protein